MTVNKFVVQVESNCNDSWETELEQMHTVLITISTVAGVLFVGQIVALLVIVSTCVYLCNTKGLQ